TANLWIDGLLSRANEWREKALASGVAAQRVPNSPFEVHPSRGPQLLPRDSVVRGSRPAPPHTSDSDSTRCSYRGRSSESVRGGEKEGRGDDSLVGCGKGTSWATGRRPACGERQSSGDCDVVETVEFDSEDSSDQASGGGSFMEEPPDNAPLRPPLRNLAEMLSSDEDEDDEPAPSPPTESQPLHLPAAESHPGRQERARLVGCAHFSENLEADEPALPRAVSSGCEEVEEACSTEPPPAPAQAAVRDASPREGGGPVLRRRNSWDSDDDVEEEMGDPPPTDDTPAVTGAYDDFDSPNSSTRLADEAAPLNLRERTSGDGQNGITRLHEHAIDGNVVGGVMQLETPARIRPVKIDGLYQTTVAESPVRIRPQSNCSRWNESE
ncbi:MAG: hypothetical protein SGPRY_007224, partial [Prymnesium sp.]